MFEEFQPQAAGGSDKKRRWIMIGVGAAVILIFILIRNAATRNAAATAAATTTSTTDPNATNPTPTVVDTGAYPDLGAGGAAGLNQTLSTYLAIADQNTSTQMAAVNNELNTVQNQMNTNNAALTKSIQDLNAKITASNVAAPAQPVTTTTPATTSHPNPSSVTHVVARGETLSGIATAAYGKQAAYSRGIRDIAAANQISNPNRIRAGQRIIIPAAP